MECLNLHDVIKISVNSSLAVFELTCLYSDFLSLPFLGTFAKLRKVTISFVMSVCPSAWNNSVSIGRIFMKFGISAFLENLTKKIPLSLKSNKNNGYVS
jgi:hypothetical protein